MDPDVRQRGRRVLIVEDQPQLRDLLMRATRDMEFEVTSTSTAEDALAQMERTEFDIVISDLNLPGLHGMEMCSRVRKKWPATQIIILTGYGQLESAKEAIRLDVVDFLTKPCSLGDLETALNRALRRRLEGMSGATATARHEAFHEPQPAQSPAPQTLQDVEREHILAALDRHQGNRARAAEELGISVRTLYYRISEYQKLGFMMPSEPTDR